MAGSSKMVPALAGAAAIGYVLYLIKRQLWYSKYSGKKLPPIYNKGIILPVLGAAAQFLWDPLKMARHAENVYGDVFTVEVFGQRLTFMLGPDAQEHVLSANDSELSQKEAYSFTVPTFGEGIIYDCDLEKRTEQIKLWLKLREEVQVTNSLHTTALSQYVPMMQEEAKLYFDKKFDKESGVVDLYEALSELIILTASRCLMGKEIRNELFDQVSALYATLDKGMMPISFFAPNLPLPAHLARNKARLTMCKLFEGVMTRRIKENRQEKDVLQVFMDAIYKNGTKLPASEVTGLMICLLFAGQHTSSVTSTWTGLYILQNKDKVLQALLDEQKGVGNTMDHECVKNMHMLHACISEALRMQPPLIFLMREVLEDREYKGMTIPKGDKVFLSPSLAGRRAEVFSKPDNYDPFRFLAPNTEDKGAFDKYAADKAAAEASEALLKTAEAAAKTAPADKELAAKAASAKAAADTAKAAAEKSKAALGPRKYPNGGLVPGGREENRKYPHGWLGFGGGRHRCIGENFAYMQIKTIWAYLLRNYELDMDGPLPDANYEALVVGPHHHQCMVKYTKRKVPLV